MYRYLTSQLFFPYASQILKDDTGFLIYFDKATFKIKLNQTVTSS